MPEKIYDKIIIGGGAAGIMAAYSACTAGKPGNVSGVLILEANDKAGKKITATGNGKCNFTNLIQEKGCYRSSDSEKAFRIVNKFDNKKTIELFKGIGIPYRERNGYCYPYGEQARTFRDIFINTVKALGVTILTEKKVKDIVRKTENILHHVRTEAVTVLKSLSFHAAERQPLRLEVTVLFSGS